MSTKIEWTGETWNFIGGCTKKSEGCRECYALRDSWRIMNNPKRPDRYDGVVEKVNGAPRWTGRINLDEDLSQPQRWVKPRTIFVCSMSDLFYEDVPLEFIDRAITAMRVANHHTYQILTKRPERLLEYLDYDVKRRGARLWWPSYIWLMISAENQPMADLRIPQLLRTHTPGAIRGVSVEPMLGPVDVEPYLCVCAPCYRGEKCGSGLQWVIIGCESGPRRRPMELEWVRDLVRQCQAAQVPVFVKQLSIDGRVSHDPAEWPEDLQVREYPR